MQIPWGSISWANIGFIVLTAFTWAAIHGSLQEKEIELHTSRVLLSELPPAATFSYTLVYYTLPALWNLILGETGSFVQIMSVLGALMFNVSAVGWISLLSDAEDSASVPDDQQEGGSTELPEDEEGEPAATEHSDSSPS